MANTKIRLIIFFAAKDGEALYSQQTQDREMTVAQIMNSLLPNLDLNWRKWRKPLDHSVQSLSCVRLFASPWTAALQASLSMINSWSLPKLMSISRWYHPTTSSSVVPSPPALFHSISLFQWISSSHQLAKVLEFQLQYQYFQWTPRTDLL